MKIKLIKDGLVFISESEEEDLIIWDLFDEGMVLRAKAVSDGKNDKKRKQLLMQGKHLFNKITTRKTKFE